MRKRMPRLPARPRLPPLPPALARADCRRQRQPGAAAAGAARAAGRSTTLPVPPPPQKARAAARARLRARAALVRRTPAVGSRGAKRYVLCRCCSCDVCGCLPSLQTHLCPALAQLCSALPMPYAAAPAAQGGGGDAEGPAAGAGRPRLQGRLGAQEGGSGGGAAGACHTHACACVGNWRVSECLHDAVLKQIDAAAAGSRCGICSHGAPPPPPPYSPTITIAHALPVLPRLLQLELPSNPLDTLIDQLGGPSAVAEMTGRKGRLVRSPTGTGVVFEPRNASGVGPGEGGRGSGRSGVCALPHCSSAKQPAHKTQLMHVAPAA